jgi:NAD(P)-dependent dehydrogenase (short-subunit alcohol dehydrogenase family)
MKKFKNILIFGSGGIGSALIEEFLLKENVENIFITYNKNKPLVNSTKIKCFKVDISSEQAICKLFELIKQHTDKIDLTINTVGVLFSDKNMPEKSINQISQDWLDYSFKVNAFAFLYINKYLYPFICKKDESAIITLSAKVGSISDNKSGGWYSYRASKAALNMFVKNIALEFSRNNFKMTVLAIHPGTTETNLTKPFQSRFNYRLHSPSDTAKNILSIIEKRKSSDSGKFLSWDNSEIEY